MTYRAKWAVIWVGGWIGIGFGSLEFVAWLDPRAGDTLSEIAAWLAEQWWGAVIEVLFFTVLLLHFFSMTRWWKRWREKRG
ncbi:MAG: hypothetical protein U1E51_30175 [Candidatus Binatia bacterium]|nr:hypothetical protein [Candidatus Binatia bacterium]